MEKRTTSYCISVPWTDVGLSLISSRPRSPDLSMIDGVLNHRSSDGGASRLNISLDAAPSRIQTPWIRTDEPYVGGRWRNTNWNANTRPDVWIANGVAQMMLPIKCQTVG
jgi:hypothetical protein